MARRKRTGGILPRGFYDRSAEEVARDLLGMSFVRQSDEGVTAGRIVETEAYLAENDPACHSARGKTRGNASMFGPPGTAYVYPIHAKYCANVVTQGEEVGSAVLIRAIEPTQGVELMQQRRGKQRLVDLTRGPGRLCQAMAIDRELDGWDLTAGAPLWIAKDGQTPADIEIGNSVRIGISSAVDLPLRFFVVGNQFVSGTRKLNSP